MLVYSDVAKLMKEYSNGQLSKAFKVIPYLEQWDKVLELTKPFEWSFAGMFAATKILASNLDNVRAAVFYQNYLFPVVHNEIQSKKTLNIHLYNALKKATYRPTSFFKGIVIPLLQSNECTLKESQIIASVLMKVSIPAIYSGVLILKLTEFPIENITGPLLIILKTMIDKKYALPHRFFSNFQKDPREMPVLWQQTLLNFCTYYSESFDDMQKATLKKCAKKKFHNLITSEIIKAIDNEHKKNESEKDKMTVE